MTRSFAQKIECPHCGKWITVETPFSRWIRKERELDSVAIGLSIADADYWIHKYKTYRNGWQSRMVQCVMQLELKTHGSELTEAQRDTLYIANQIMRNRRQTPTKNLRHQAGTAPLKAYSTMSGHNVHVRNFGVQLLRLSGTSPDDSEHIWWGKGREIEIETLIQLLRFDLDPDTLRPLDLRRHHPNPQQNQMMLDLEAP